MNSATVVEVEDRPKKVTANNQLSRANPEFSETILPLTAPNAREVRITAEIDKEKKARSVSVPYAKEFLNPYSSKATEPVFNHRGYNGYQKGTSENQFSRTDAVVMERKESSAKTPPKVPARWMNTTVSAGDAKREISLSSQRSSFTNPISSARSSISNAVDENQQNRDISSSFMFSLTDDVKLYDEIGNRSGQLTQKPLNKRILNFKRSATSYDLTAEVTTSDPDVERRQSHGLRRNPTADQIDQYVQIRAEDFTKTIPGGGFPMTPMQDRLLDFVTQYPTSDAYHRGGFIHVSGRSAEEWKRCLDSLSHSHDALRTVLLEKTGGFYQSVDPTPNFEWSVINGSMSRQDEDQLMRRLFQKPFDLRVSSWRAIFFPRTERLFSVFHHIFIDHFSIQTIIKQLILGKVENEHSQQWITFSVNVYQYSILKRNEVSLQSYIIFFCL